MTGASQKREVPVSSCQALIVRTAVRYIPQIFPGGDTRAPVAAVPSFHMSDTKAFVRRPTERPRNRPSATSRL